MRHPIKANLVSLSPDGTQAEVTIKTATGTITRHVVYSPKHDCYFGLAPWGRERVPYTTERSV